VAPWPRRITETLVREIEIKLPIDNVPAMRRRLRRLGFQPVTPRLFERNLLFDTPAQSLRSESQLLRLRSKGRQWWLTYKARPENASRHKIRDEIEIETPQGPELATILERLGFRPTFEYQKYRTEYRRPRARGLILVDETPVGNYLELEGPPRWIDRTAVELGYGTGDYILESYGMLYLGWCRRKAIEPSNMVFPEKKGLLPPKL
jgi:adenylate cyclase class 2